MIDSDLLQSLREILNVSELNSDVLEILGDYHYMYSKIDEENFKTLFEVPEGIERWEWIENRGNNYMEDLTNLGFTEDQANCALAYVQ